MPLIRIALIDAVYRSDGTEMGSLFHLGVETCSRPCVSIEISPCECRCVLGQALTLALLVKKEGGMLSGCRWVPSTLGEGLCATTWEGDMRKWRECKTEQLPLNTFENTLEKQLLFSAQPFPCGYSIGPTIPDNKCTIPIRVGYRNIYY